MIEWTKSIFARHGIPETVISDNGPQFSSKEYSDFTKLYQFNHVTSSPYFPQSNGEAERAVGTVKNLLRKEKDPYLALLAYRSTPLHNGYSPSELLMSRKLRTTIPISKELRLPQVPDLSAIRKKEEVMKKKQKENFDNHHKAKELSHLDYRDVVWIPQQETEAVVTDEVAPRSYELVTANGSVIRRNRRDLIQLADNLDCNRNSEDIISPSILEPPEPPEPPRRSQRISQPPIRYGLKKGRCAMLYIIAHAHKDLMEKPHVIILSSLVIIVLFVPDSLMIYCYI